MTGAAARSRLVLSCARVRGAAEAAHASLSSCAAASGVSRASLWRYLNGEREMPASALVALADYLGVEPRSLFDEAPR